MKIIDAEENKDVKTIKVTIKFDFTSINYDTFSKEAGELKRLLGLFGISTGDIVSIRDTIGAEGQDLKKFYELTVKFPKETTKPA